MGIAPQFWNHRDLRRLEPTTRLVAAFALSGRPAMDVPGLLNVGPGAIAEEMYIRTSVVEQALEELEEVAFVELDEDNRIVRVPNAPNYVPKPNDKMIKAWWNRWKLLPDSPLKFRHIGSLQLALAETSTESVINAWNETFGSIEQEEIERQSLAFVKGKGRVNGTLPLETVTVTVPVTVPVTVSGKGKAKAKGSARVNQPSDQARSLALELASLIAQRLPKSRVAKDPEGNAESWMAEIDRLHRIDGQDWDEVDRVMRWSQSDSFWQGNILSGKKLREKFTTLQAQMASKRNANGSAVGQYKHTGDEVYAGGEVEI